MTIDFGRLLPVNERLRLNLLYHGFIVAMNVTNTNGAQKITKRFE